MIRDPRVDQVVWCSRNDGGSCVDVLTTDRGALRFAKVADGRRGVRDAQGARWRVDGELGAVDADITDAHIQYGAYPNALERLLEGLDHDRAGRLWLTARPGFEFRLPGQRVHNNAGSHGALHQTESLVRF